MWMVLASLTEHLDSISGPLLWDFKKMEENQLAHVQVNVVLHLLLLSLKVTFCEAGIESYDMSRPPMLYSNDPLWDGHGCISSNPCCSFNNPPWFYKQLPQPTTDDIEIRVCRDEDASNEDVTIEIVEIYIQY